jgi:hypothetical protein
MLFYIKKIKNCPVCGHTEAVFHSQPLPNLYSEKIAAVLGVNEEDLLKQHCNYKCTNCGVLYKRNWFESKYLEELFLNVVPSHPKGWDVMSGRFSFENFYSELNAYRIAIAQKNIELQNRYRRALKSLLDSIPEVCDNLTWIFLYKAIEIGDLAVFEDIEVKRMLSENMHTPIPFKRFAGFSGSNLWKYIESKVGPIKNYAELGCPLWGMLKYSSDKGLKTTFYSRFEPNYWSVNCKSAGKQCVDFLKDEIKIPVINWSNVEKGFLIGFFQYLDHLEEPIPFLEKVFGNFDHAAVILDHINEPTYIQHFTGWSESTMHFLANKYNRILYTDFKQILPSGNILYLFAKS